MGDEWVSEQRAVGGDKGEKKGEGEGEKERVCVYVSVWMCI